ncbi:hypothetical protein IT570_11940 [Candidatus Sumerlaeota bacterium]|nr:hypothetical protein [Candidatus Sumerlaeota bacterium]
MSADYPELFAPTEAPPAPPPRRSILDWLPVVLTVPFVLLFLMTVMPRLGVPFELEWNEGQSGEQAWRFEKGLPLYPSTDQNWVPYMYAPLYHIAWGTVMKVTGVHTLGLGRMISFLASIATGMGLFMIVWDRARRSIPALFAACLYYAYFKPSGYWYDMARVDALAFGLCAWGMYLTLKERVCAWQGVLGLLVLLLGSLTKQTVAAVGLYCALALLFKNPRGLLIGGFVCALAVVNFLFVFQREGNDAFIKYTYTNALKHSSSSNVYFPNGEYRDNFMADVPAPRGISQIAVTYFGKWKDPKSAPAVWRECGRHVWIFLLMILGWLVAGLFRRRAPNGWIHVPPALALAFGGLEGYAKYGGYMNNFMPLFMGVCILMGLALAELRTTVGARFPGIFGGAAGLLIFLQLFQPWGIARVSNDEANGMLVRGIHDQALRNGIIEYSYKLSAREKARGNPAAPSLEISEPPPFSLRFTYQALRFLAPGMAYFPSTQWPPDSSQRAYESLMGFLVRKREQKEPVLIVHHQWYGLTAGHPMAMNADMVRCAQWAGDPVPPEMAATASDHVYTWIITDTPDLQYDWIPLEFRNAIQQSYEPFGPTPFLDSLNEPGALQPLTGAEKWPMTILRRRGSQSSLLDGTVFEMDTAPGTRMLPNDQRAAMKNADGGSTATISNEKARATR